MIPVTIRPAYWIFTAVLSLLLSEGNPLQLIIWMVIIFVSVLFHEYGHALTAKIFGRKPRIELVAMGGVTYHDGAKLPFWKQFLITLDGPLFGFILGIVCAVLHQVVTIPLIKKIFYDMSVVNIFWTIVNLVPVLPLDGGQLLRIGLEKWLGFKGLRYTFLVSSIFSFLFSVGFFLTQQIFAGAIFFLFAYENFVNFRRSKNFNLNDQSDEMKKTLVHAEQLFRQERKQEALEAFQSIRAATKDGMLYDVATQYCALILADQGDPKAAYDLLKPLQERLDPPSLLLLHRLAFEHQDDSVVASIGPQAFQLFPLAEVALRNAYTSARLNQLQSTIGWLETAKQNGVENLKEIVQESDFDQLRNEPTFVEFVKSL